MSDGYPLSDLGNAQRLVAAHGTSFRFCHAWGKALVDDGRCWAIDDTGEVERLAKRTVRRMLTTAEGIDDRAERKAYLQHQLRTESARGIQAMVTLAQTEPGIPVRPDELDADPMQLNCLNGIIDLRTGELRPHDPTALMTKLAPVEYHPEATCPTWTAVLERVFGGCADLIDYFCRGAGYTATGLTSEQVLFMPYGLGANGKSTILGQLQRTLGDYALQADFATFLETRDGAGASPGLARLKGARMVAAVEAEEGRRLNEVLIKQITGQDRISARHLYHEPFEFTPALKLWLATNHKPNVRGTDSAIWRRIHLIPFEVTIPPQDRDLALASKLDAEAPGILAWIVRGCREWLKYGLRPPAVVLKATEDYRTEMDVLGAFLDECCVIGADLKVQTKALYAAYEEWCHATGERPLNQRAMGLRLEERGFTAGRSGTIGRYRVGFGLLARSDAVTDGDATSDFSYMRGDMGKRAGNSDTMRHASPVRALEA